MTAGIAIVASGALFGILIGSFLNVVVYRVPIGMSLVAPASACPNCHSGIKGYDNIPVVSWLLLGGRCRQCKAPISVRYPLVEAGTAVFFGVVAAFFAPSISSAHTVAGAVSAALALVAFLYLTAISVALALIDLETHRLPNAIVLPAYAVGAVLLGAAALVGGHWDALLRGGAGVVALAALYFVLALVSRGGMGLGDVKLAGVLGLYLGWSGWGSLLVGAFAAFILGGVFGMALIVSRRAGRRSGIPFGPWMLAGAWIGIFAGDQLWTGYLSALGLSG
ncbi:prepilin peptidase [Galbitalea soli]|uniref:Prepilin leader peptidase/N-methyltransferase n=1 Tax=Galbitalea soli TaxID=1268042 RepID=A0A7C9TRR2_9MICO|nr:A24 family peptidase [Galbitalea soli]NEM91203.1 prepilin peptidase [Galbitalea soli]NYJ29892.1 leader peptidase (prepilin peptidase)/N-methyltransferase [Galbitalea soli]